MHHQNLLAYLTVTANTWFIFLKAGLKAKEDEMKRQEDEREDEEYKKLEEERLLLQGPSIHECCRSGDLSRAKKLINHSPSIIGYAHLYVEVF